MKRVEADVVVVGGGGSGLAAAIAAATAGGKTILLEKNPQIGGTTSLSVGSITSTRTKLQKAKGIVDSPDEHFHDMGLFLGPNDYRENKELRRVLVDHIPETMEWLISIGLTFYGPMPEPPHRKPRMHNVLPNSRAYPFYLGREARRRNVDIRVNARAQSLIRQDGRVVGVVADVDGVPTEFIARGGVILASGDFSSGEDIKKIFKPDVAHIDAINPASTGDGQRIAMEHGVPVLNGDILWGPTLRFKAPLKDNLLRRLKPSWLLTRSMKFALDNLPMWMFRPFIMSFMTSSLAPEPMMYKHGAILVNSSGKRFTEELDRPEYEIPRQAGKSAYLLFDDTVAQKFERWPYFVSTAPGVAYAYVSDYKRHRKDIFHTGGTLEELAQKIGVPAATLVSEISKHNAGLKKTAPDDERTPVVRGPFYALGPVQSWVVLTEGGLAVDTSHRVLGADNQVIPGLYAAGSTGQGGLILAGHGHHIGWAMTSGRRAGRFAAEAAAAAR